jgi:hypothetical protein
VSDTGYAVGATVRVRRAWPPGHVRAPWYLRGCSGAICHVVGDFGNPEELAYGRYGGPKLRLYRVRFRQVDIWPDYDGSPNDHLEVELYENWLEDEEEKAA